jgi:pilus assembly protein CpaB
MSQLPATLRTLLTMLGGWPRRAAALVCLAIAALAAIGVGGQSGSAAMGSVLVASRALEPGVVLTGADLDSVRWPATAVPAAALRQSGAAVGRRVAAALARGEPIQSSSLLDPAIATALQQGKVATTVALADPHQAAILARGSHIDLYGAVEATGFAHGTAESPPIARNAIVLAILPVTSEMNGSINSSNALGLIIATDPATAGHLAAHLSTSFLATLVPPP